MSSQTTSIIDHARLEATARDLRAHAPDFDVTAECQAILEAFDREVCEGTNMRVEDSIWEEPRARLVAWLSIIQEKVSEVGDALIADAALLEEISRKTRATDEDTATQARSLGQSLDGLGIGGVNVGLGWTP